MAQRGDVPADLRGPEIEDLFLLVRQEGLNSTCRYCGQQVGLIQLDHTSAPRTASLLVVQFATNQP